jgi:hypothetical protein
VQIQGPNCWECLFLRQIARCAENDHGECLKTKTRRLGMRYPHKCAALDAIYKAQSSSTALRYHVQRFICLSIVAPSYLHALRSQMETIYNWKSRDHVEKTMNCAFRVTYATHDALFCLCQILAHDIGGAPAGQVSR